MRKQHTCGHRQNGVTLIEQLMVLVIVAVLTTVAAPVLSGLLTRTRLQTAQMDFIAASQSAREMAITTGKQTLFCPTRDGASCNADSDWEYGWLVAVDADHDDQPDNHSPLRIGQGYAGKLAIRSSSGRHLVRFQPDGSAHGANLSILFCQPAGNEPVLSVVVSNSGRIRGGQATATQADSCRTGL